MKKEEVEALASSIEEKARALHAELVSAAALTEVPHLATMAGDFERNFVNWWPKRLRGIAAQLEEAVNG